MGNVSLNQIKQKTKSKPSKYISHSFVNHSGLKTPSLKEYGFNNENFIGDFYDVEKELSVRSKTLSTEEENSFLSDPVEISKPAPLGDVEGFQVGSAGSSLTSLTLPSSLSNIKKTRIQTRKGFFCEKPAYSFKDTILKVSETDTDTMTYPSYYFPLGTSGSSLDPSFKAEGFDFKSFSQGGNIEEGYTLKSCVKGIQGSTFENKDFGYNKGYDRNCFYSFEGAHSRKPSENLLKYPCVEGLEDLGYYIDSNSSPLVIQKGDYLSLDLSEAISKDSTIQGKIEGCSLKNLLSVKISIVKDEKETPYNDFYIDSNYSIKSNNPFKEKSTLKIRYSLHNYWNETSCEKIAHNFLNTPEGFKIPAGSSFNFEKKFEVKEDGYYIFSLYAKYSPKVQKTSGDHLDTYIQKFCIKNERGDIVNESSLSSNNYSLGKGEILDKENLGVRINSEWRRYAFCTYLSSQYNPYYIHFEWPGDLQYRGSLSIMGLCVEKDELSTYNNQDINYTLLPLKGNNNFHVLSLILPEFSLENDWVLSYLKKSEGFSENSYSGCHVDSIGKLSFGYKGSDFVKGENTEPSNSADNLKVDTSSFRNPGIHYTTNALKRYNGWDQVIITFKTGSSTIAPKDPRLEIEFYGEGGFNNKEDKRTSNMITINLKGKEDLLNTSNIKGTEFNLLLGGYLKEGELNLCNNIYRDIMWFPKGMGMNVSVKGTGVSASDDNACRLKSIFLSSFIEKGLNETSPDSASNWEEDNLIIKSPFFFETLDNVLKVKEKTT